MHNTKEYILCAMIRHERTTPDSGHFVAEAMDWLMGQWFEFNDNEVVVLEKGPSNSSTAAYCMYYVDKVFLAESILNQLRKIPMTPKCNTTEYLELEKYHSFHLMILDATQI